MNLYSRQSWIKSFLHLQILDSPIKSHDRHKDKYQTKWQSESGDHTYQSRKLTDKYTRTSGACRKLISSEGEASGLHLVTAQLLSELHKFKPYSVLFSHHAFHLYPQLLHTQKITLFYCLTFSACSAENSDRT